ncbi:MAG: HAD hydrolase family protein, partial [Mycoplasmataceae bacterium]|nr:HAD hydrolase family protein [Mycoplasmataceae bacterium]
ANIKKIKEINKETPMVISTGRNFNEKIKYLMKLLEIKYAICQNGAIIVNNRFEILQDISIQQPMIEAIKNIAVKYRLTLVPNSKYIVHNSSWYFKPLIAFNKKHYFKMEDFDTSQKYNKIVLSGCFRKKLFKIYLEMRNTYPNLSIKTSGKDWIIEITDIKATKGIASLAVAKMLNVKPSKSVHIGDSMNDTTTLDHLGALIAMENSSKHLLDVATHIGPNYKRGGLAKVLSGEFSENLSRKSKN